MGNSNCVSKESCRRCPDVDVTQACPEFIRDRLSHLSSPTTGSTFNPYDSSKLREEGFYMDKQDLEKEILGNRPTNDRKLMSAFSSNIYIQPEYSFSDNKSSPKALNDSISHTFLYPSSCLKPSIWSPKGTNEHQNPIPHDEYDGENVVVSVLEDDRHYQEQRFAPVEEEGNTSLIEYNCEDRESRMGSGKLKETFQLILTSKEQVGSGSEHDLSGLADAENLTPRFTHNFTNTNNNFSGAQFGKSNKSLGFSMNFPERQHDIYSNNHYRTELSVPARQDRKTYETMKSFK